MPVAGTFLRVTLWKWLSAMCAVPRHGARPEVGRETRLRWLVAVEEDGLSRDIVYRELHGYLWVALGLGALAIALFLSSSLLDHPLGGSLVLVGVLFFLLAVMAEGIHRMNCITLRPNGLTVGRETFSRDDIDALFGVQPALVLQPEEQDRVEEEWPVAPDATMRIAGGSWGRRRGTHLVVVREAATQDLVAVFSRDPATLDRHLSAWLRELPDSPAGLD